jgi:hypothetical protein
MRARGLTFEEIAAVLERPFHGCRHYYARVMRYKRDYGRLPDAGELYGAVNKVHYFKDASDDAILPPPEPDDGYRAPHRRIYDRLPPSSAELMAARRKEWEKH